MLTGPPPKFHGTRDILHVPGVAVGAELEDRVASRGDEVGQHVGDEQVAADFEDSGCLGETGPSCSMCISASAMTIPSAALSSKGRSAASASSKWASGNFARAIASMSGEVSNPWTSCPRAARCWL
jgi:hypothetical protein